MGTSHKIILGDAAEGLRQLPAGCVHSIVTSPPYYGQRNYGDLPGEIGAEELASEYALSLARVMGECRRVLRDDGTLWLNLGDKFVNGEPLGLPWRVAFMLSSSEWSLRQDIIWSKATPMPGAAGSKCLPAHEYVFLLSKSGDYFFDSVAIREPAAHGGTKNRRSVWHLASTPYAGSHFATMPTTLAELCIKAGTSAAGCCSKCGAPLERVVEKTKLTRERPNDYVKRTGAAGTGNSCANTVAGVETKTVGWRLSCRCENQTEIGPCTVLDPFGGSGTTAAVAKSLGHNSILCELNPDYAQLARERIAGTPEGELFVIGDKT